MANANANENHPAEWFECGARFRDPVPPPPLATLNGRLLTRRVDIVAFA